MPSSREQESKLLQTWKANSSRLLTSFSGSGISFKAETSIKNLGVYDLDLNGISCAIKVKLEHAELFIREPGLLEILLSSGDKIILRESTQP